MNLSLVASRSCDPADVEEATGGLTFHALAAPTEDEMARVLAMIAVRLRRLLERRGRGAMEPDVETEDLFHKRQYWRDTSGERNRSDRGPTQPALASSRRMSHAPRFNVDS